MDCNEFTPRPEKSPYRHVGFLVVSVSGQLTRIPFYQAESADVVRCEKYVSSHKLITYSCRTPFRREALIWSPPSYPMQPSFLNLFMKKLTRERVVPIISASVPCDTLGSIF